MSMEHKSHQILEEELQKAGKQVKVGGTYSHFKHPERLYKVVSLGVQEGTDRICVIYRAEYNKDLVFVRDLDSWLEKPKEGIDRFTLVAGGYART
jgi:hypothetical protein